MEVKQEETGGDLIGTIPGPVDRERIHLIPNDLLKRNTELENSAPKALEGVPFYHLEQIIKLSPLLKKYGAIKQLTSLENIGSGTKGVVFRIHVGKLDVALKLFDAINMGEKDADMLLSSANVPTYDQLSPEKRQTDLGMKLDMEAHGKSYQLSGPREIFKDRFTRTSGLPEWFNISEDRLAQVAAFKLGHALEPDYVPEPIGVLTYKGKPVGYILPFLQGTPVNSRSAYDAFPYSDDPQRETEIFKASINNLNIELTPQEEAYRQAREKFMKARKRLEEAGICIDDQIERANAISQKGVGLKLIDLGLKDPQDLNFPISTLVTRVTRAL